MLIDTAFVSQRVGKIMSGCFGGSAEVLPL